MGKIPEKSRKILFLNLDFDRVEIEFYNNREKWFLKLGESITENRQTWRGGGGP